MLPKELFFFLATIITTYGYLKINKIKKYKYLEKIQKDIINNCKLDFSPYNPGTLPLFTDRVVTIHNLLPETTFSKLRATALRHLSTERSYFPGHKKRGHCFL